MAKANKKLVGSMNSEEKVQDHATMDATGAVDVADAATVDDADKSAVGNGSGPAGAKSEPVPVPVGTTVVREAASEPLQFGLTPNPPLADMNRAAEANRRARANGEYVAAQRVLSRAFKRRVIG